ncbi:MAG: bifunctional DNA-formamidopyrimidine glycosylase/DNA-(apurinic or apyrimidinic site) lyase [Endozoicomonas sp.]
MPELPEVETTRRGIHPHVEGQVIDRVEVREYRLRWPVPDNIDQALRGKTVKAVRRRAKYLLLEIDQGCLILHLGMSGSLRVLLHQEAPKKHDHVDFVLKNGTRIRYTDPRRFGAVLWTEQPVHDHKLLKHLGPEPLEGEFTEQRLFQFSRGRSQPVKTFIMDNKVVVGVGNIYANEALFRAGIHPERPCGKISKARCLRLTQCIRDTLAEAIAQGGTTLRDFVGGDGKPGYFKQELAVYGRAGQPCLQCSSTIKEIKLGNRSTCFCPKCQKA